MRRRAKIVGAVVLVAVATMTSATVATAQAAPAEWHYSPSTDHYYGLIGPASWEAAEAAAVSMGGHLVTITDDSEQAWLTTTFPYPELWIGFNDRDIEGTWVWSSGEPVTYLNWEFGEPNNCTHCGPPDGTGALPGGEDGAVMNWRWNEPLGTYRYWNDLWVGYELGAIVEVDLAAQLSDMVTAGELPSRGVAGSIERLADSGKVTALTKLLNGLVRAEKISVETRDEILQYVNVAV